MSIKTNFEIPRSTEIQDIATQGQRTAQDLSKNFKSVKNTIDEINTSITALNTAVNANSSTYGLDGKIFTQSFTVTVGAAAYYGATNYTFTHDFGANPTGFVVLDHTNSSGNAVSMITRTSWTTTQITVKISSVTVNGSAQTITGSFTILVLR